MRATAASGRVGEVEADWAALGVWSDGAATGAGEELSAFVRRLVEGEDFEAKVGATLPLFDPPGGPSRVLLVGLGEREKATLATFDQAASLAMKMLARKAERIALALAGGESTSVDAAKRTEAITRGALAGSVGPDFASAGREAGKKLAETIILDGEAEGVRRGEIVGNAINLARELVNRSADEIFPESFCERAAQVVSDHGLKLDLTVLEPGELSAEGMNCILAVGRGSTRPPRLLVSRYHGADESAPTLALVGKGITFDAGGLSIKPNDSMLDMRCDMAGAATVWAATTAVAKLGLPVNLMTLTPLAENMISGSSYKLGDVFKAKNGKTIEICNTDAEGRLVLADALCHAVDLGADRVVDLATLTGACVVALGHVAGGVMSNDDAWRGEVLAAAERAGELAWPLPMYDGYDELIASERADMKNVGGRWGGAITAAKLLAEFVADKPWTHVDIAGPAFLEMPPFWGYYGATGYFARSLVELGESGKR